MTTDNRTRKYLASAHFGGLASMGLAAAWLLDLPDFFKGLSVGILLIPLVVIPLRRMRDEYLDSLWQAGTAWAFVAVVACFVFIPFTEGLFDGFTGLEHHQDFPGGTVGFAGIAAFFIGFHVKWLRGLR